MRTALTVSLCLLVASCSKSTSSDAPSPQPRSTSPIAAKLLAAVPSDAWLVGIADGNTSPWDYAMDGFGFIRDKSWNRHRQALERELTAFIDERVGLDFTALKSAVFFARGKKQGGLIVHGVGGTLRGKTSTRLGATVLRENDADIAKIGDLMVIGPPASVDLVLKSLQKPHAPGRLVSWHQRSASGAYFAVVADAAQATTLLGPMPIPKLDLASAVVDHRGIRLELNGPDGSLKQLKTLADQGIAMALGELDKEKSKATAANSDTAEGVATIMAYHWAAYFAEVVTPKLGKGSLIIEGPSFSSDQSVWIATVGVLAAIAVPAFMKYVKRSKTEQAAEYIEGIEKESNAYETQRKDSGK